MIRPPLLCFVASVVTIGAAAQEQDFSALRINEVIADNKNTSPPDVGGGTTDMIEIYNTGDLTLRLGTDNPDQSLALSDTLVLPTPTALWTFGRLASIAPGKSMVVFCDGNAVQNACEPHASFQIASDGSEPITLWGPVVNGTREVIDQVWLPPLPNDVSVGRFPDGAGPAPVPLDQVREVFVYNPPGQATFGSCVLLAPCGAGQSARFCGGDDNGPGTNLKPKVERSGFSSNSPAPGEAVSFDVRVEDDQEPTPPNIAAVEIVYAVDGRAAEVVPMAYDSVSGIQHGRITDAAGQDLGPNPFNVWTIWKGSIPGQPKDARVELHFRVRDAEGAADTSPGTLCGPGVGPCHRDFGGPGCSLDTADVTCSGPSFTGARYVECSKPFTYTVGYEPRGDLIHVVVNEVLAWQDGVVFDPTGRRACGDEDLCPRSVPECCRYRDDVIELHNTSGGVTVNLSGLWVSSSPFGPRAWQFPPGSSILPGEYMMVWLDNDGAKCPDPDLDPMPCFWECPDPTDARNREFHTNFSLNRDGDQVYIFDDEAHRFGVIHGLEFGAQRLNHSWSLMPDGDRNGSGEDARVPTIGAPNIAVTPEFVRGDADGNCGVEITDAVFTLNSLFKGGPAPPCPDAADTDDNGSMDLADGVYLLNYLFRGGPDPEPPGPETPGPDPTADGLESCEATSC